MSIGLRCRHDRSVRELAAGMFGEGPPPFQYFETVCLSTPYLLATSEKFGVFCQHDLSRRGWYRFSVPFSLGCKG